jgi:hypothetical protein
MAVWILRKQRKKKQKSQEFISRFKVTQLSFSACKHTNAKSKFWFPSKVEIKVILHDMLTCHSLGFTINTCTINNSTVYQAETTSMCTVNISAWMHHIVSSKQILINQQHCKRVDIKNQTRFQRRTTHNYAQYTEHEAT